MGTFPPVKRPRVLLSVTDKRGLAEVADQLQALGYELIASGGTAAFLAESGFTVTAVDDFTGFPEIFDGRVKTLHPAVMGGILGPRLEDFEAVADLGIVPIDVVCVNLYRFEEAVASGADEFAAIERIDIGGPSLLRAAAKNFHRVTVLSDPVFYPEFLRELKTQVSGTSLAFRRRMAAVAFARVAAYNRAIAGWLGSTLPAAQASEVAPLGQVDIGETAADLRLRYGENPHQEAWLQIAGLPAGPENLEQCGLTQLGGKELSYNNLVDLVAALKLVGDFQEQCCGVIKHTNPCGFALGPAAPALERALLCDPVSAFGGVFAFNGPVDRAATERLAKMFYEIVAAPEFSTEALAKLQKKKKVRIVAADLSRFAAATNGRSRSFGRLTLRQQEDEGFPEIASWRIVAGPAPKPEIQAALEMGWKVCKHGKSNAVVVADQRGTLGCGFGQMSRVDSVKIALRKADEQGLDLTGAVAASDGFFPFPDGVEHLAGAGVRAVVAPGGSIRDEEVATAAAKLGVTFILAERRHFNH